MFVGRKLSIGSVFWFINVGFAFADGVVQVASDTKISGDSLLASPKADVTSVRCLPDDEKYLRDLFSNEGVFSKDSVDKGAALLRLSWKRAYYKSCCKLLSAGERREQANLLAKLDKSGKSGFVWMCNGWRQLSAIEDVCPSGKSLTSNEVFSEEVFRSFINKVLSLCKEHSQLSFEILKALVMPNGVLLMPIKDFPQGLDASRVTYLLCDFRKPLSFVGRLKCKVCSFTNVVWEWKPMQISAIVIFIKSLFDLREAYKKFRGQSSADGASSAKSVKPEDQLKPEILSMLNNLDPGIWDKIKDFDPELLAEIRRINVKLSDKRAYFSPEFLAKLEGLYSELSDKFKESNAYLDRRKSLDEKLQEYGPILGRLKKVSGLCDPQDGYQLSLEDVSGGDRKRRRRVNCQGERLVPSNTPTNTPSNANGISRV